MNRRQPKVFELDEVAFEEELVGGVEAEIEAEEARRAADDEDLAEEEERPRRARRARRRKGRRAAAEAEDDIVDAEVVEDEEDDLGPQPAASARSRRGRARRAGRRALSWFSLFATGLLGLVTLALSISLYVFVEDLLARVPVLGGVAAVLAGLLVIGLLGMVLREWVALRRLREVESLRTRADAAVAADDPDAARKVLSELVSLYGDRPETARGRKALRAHMREVIDGRDLVVLAERELLAPLDREAVTAIVGASRRVAAVTALSPRALVDVGYVIFAALSLVRRLATIYGGRPGTLGFLRVLRHAVAQLAVTGGMAAGDSLVGEVIGQGLAARLSAKLGEGVVNGLMTARLGLAALDVLRPLPFTGTRRPRVSDVLSEIGRIAPKDDKDKDS